eukprot:TRINITY_DN2681_c1_g1_i8.p1 TRINITY_DN2681_c1_g1~~TRINITY_DN2681_c1_g1_i8.p1  ORF type:complete len:151 (-),score=12.14 TRINITY_DN2681_c1_g1_i8:18-470(-)
MEDPLSESERQKKILEFESFLNEKLKKDLDKVLERRDHVYDEIAKYLEVKSAVVRMKESQEKSLKTLVNLGHEFFVQAKVPDASRIIIEVGLGFYVEYALDEALAFLDMKEEQLNSKADKFTEASLAIKAQMNIMLHLLTQLMNLPMSKE